jgi:hypothetical protein
MAWGKSLGKAYTKASPAACDRADELAGCKIMEVGSVAEQSKSAARDGATLAPENVMYRAGRALGEQTASAVQRVEGWSDAMVDSGKELGKQTASAIVEGAQWTYEGGKEIIKQTASTAYKGAQQTYEVGKEIATRTGSAMYEAAQLTYESGKELATWTGSAIYEGGRLVYEGGKEIIKQTASAMQAGAAWVGSVFERGKQLVKQAAKVVWTAAVDAGEMIVRGVQNVVMEFFLNVATSLLEPLVYDIYQGVYAIKDAWDWLFGDGAPSPSLDCDGGAKGLSDRKADGMLMGADGKVTDDLRVAKGNAVGPSADNKCCKDKGLQHPERVIYYVNGVLTDQHTHSTTLQKIADSLCARVVGVYNATEGAVMDYLQTGKDRQLVQMAALGLVADVDGRNLAVDRATATIVAEIQANRVREANGLPPQPIEVLCHSQGGAVTSMALYRAQNQMAMQGMADPLKDVQVVSMGAAAPIWPGGIKHTPYVHADDWVPNSLGLLFARLFDGPDKNGRFSRPGEPGFDRTLMSPTANHGVDSGYLKMYEQDRGGGCGKPYDEQKAAEAAAAALATGASGAAAAMAGAAVGH